MFFRNCLTSLIIEFQIKWRHINKIKTSVPASVNYLYRYVHFCYIEKIWTICNVFCYFSSGTDSWSILSSVTQRQWPHTSAIPIRAMACRQCLSLSVFQLKGKHSWNLHCHNGVVDTFGQGRKLLHQYGYV